MPGVYDNWDEARQQTEGFPGAKFKSYSSSEEATEAYRNSSIDEDKEELYRIISSAHPTQQQNGYIVEETNLTDLNPEIDYDAWAVDAACSGNPGTMEYRGVNLKTGEEVFHVGPFQKATNNIGEYLALVHAMSLMAQRGEWHNIYSDSKTAISWVRNKRIKTRLQPTPQNQKVFELLARASVWVNNHVFPMKIIKWDTKRWGEIPADFGRK